MIGNDNLEPQNTELKMVKLGRQQRWSEEELKKLLEFILMNPNRFQNGLY
jgi:hypothetical protein